MAQYVPFSEGVEVKGEAILSILNGPGMSKNRAQTFLKENGIENPTPGQWYPQRNLLNVYRTIDAQMGTNTLWSIGSKIPDTAIFPPEIDSIQKALTLIDAAYHMNHRGGEIGSYKYFKTGDHSARILCHNPYPCRFDQGLIEAIARKFKPAKSLGVFVRHDEKAPCRKNGAESCTYDVSW